MHKRQIMDWRILTFFKKKDMILLPAKIRTYIKIKISNSE